MTRDRRPSWRTAAVNPLARMTFAKVLRSSLFITDSGFYGTAFVVGFLWMSVPSRLIENAPVIDIP